MPRILVVEDYPNLQLLYKTVLEAEGFEVTSASDGNEALEKVRENEPDLILLDLLMPRQDGLRFLREFDAKEHPEVKVIVFSNMASPELSKEATRLGASQYLVKAKYTPKQMAEVIKKSLKS